MNTVSILERTISTCLASFLPSTPISLIASYAAPPPLRDRTTLQREYLARHADNPLKTRPLIVISMNNDQQRKTVLQTLQLWEKTSREKAALCKEALYSRAPQNPLYSAFKGEEERFQSAEKIAEQAEDYVDNHDYDVHVLVDDFKKMRIQAVSLSQNTLFGSTKEISYLVSAPHNVPGIINQIFHEEEQVEGAGCALIEAAVYRTQAKVISKTRIVIEHTAHARAFYDHIYFTLSNSVNAILTGDNLLHFLAQYGGRAQVMPDA